MFPLTKVSRQQPKIDDKIEVFVINRKLAIMSMLAPKVFASVKVVTSSEAQSDDH